MQSGRIRASQTPWRARAYPPVLDPIGVPSGSAGSNCQTTKLSIHAWESPQTDEADASRYVLGRAAKFLCLRSPHRIVSVFRTYKSVRNLMPHLATYLAPRA